MNWFILLLIPLVALPVVLLFGFSGCPAFSEGQTDPPPAPTGGTPSMTAPKAPLNLKATALDTSRILVTWTDTNATAADYTVARELSDGSGKASFNVGKDESRTDTGLAEGVTYRYFVTATLGGQSATAGPEVAKTLEWKKAFDTTALVAVNDADHNGDCLVQRIDKASFTTSGSKVRVTLRAGNGVLNLDLVTISFAAGAAGSATPNPWDSAPPVVPLGSGVLTAAGTPVLLGPVDFAVDGTKDVIIAFDIAAGNGATRKVTNVAGTSRAHIHNGIAQAKNDDRDATGYNTEMNSVYFIETIEVLSA